MRGALPYITIRAKAREVEDEWELGDLPISADGAISITG